MKVDLVQQFFKKQRFDFYVIQESFYQIEICIFILYVEDINVFRFVVLLLLIVEEQKFDYNFINGEWVKEKWKENDGIILVIK